MQTILSRSAGRARIAIRSNSRRRLQRGSAPLALVGLADAVVALEPGDAGGVAGSGSAGVAALHLVVRLADAVVALFAARAGRIAQPGGGVLGVRIAHAVVAFLACQAGGAAGRAVLQLDFDFAELAHAGLVGAVVAILDLDVHEIVVAVVHLHPDVGVVHANGDAGGLRERETVRFDLDSLRPTLVPRLAFAERHLRALRQRAGGNGEGRGRGAERAAGGPDGLGRRGRPAAARGESETACGEGKRLHRHHGKLLRLVGRESGMTGRALAWGGEPNREPSQTV